MTDAEGPDDNEWGFDDGFLKLYGSILDSSVWAEPGPTRLVWITMLLTCDKKGRVRGAETALARRANVTLAECRTALETLAAPDIESQSKEWGGRRIEPIERGWLILNYTTYRNRRSKKQLEESARQQEYREQRSDGFAPAGGYVYYARDAEEVKIGFGKNPWARVEEMRTVRPAIRLIATEPGTLQTERERHEQFAKFRIATTGRGREWFRWSPEIAAHVQRLLGDGVRSDRSTTEDRSNTPSHTAVDVAGDVVGTTTAGDVEKDVESVEKLDRVGLVVAANLGLEAHPKRPQKVPRILPGMGSTVEAAEKLEQARVPLKFAESAIYEIGKGHRSDTEIRSLLYFVPGVLRRWQEAKQVIEMASASRPADLPTNEPHRPTTQEREAARERERADEIEKSRRERIYVKARAKAVAEWAKTHPAEYSTIVEDVKKEMGNIGPMSGTMTSAVIDMTCVERYQCYPALEGWKEEK